MASASMVHAIGMLSTLAIFMIISYASVNYITSTTQAVISSQLKEVAARVSSTAIDLTVLAMNSKSESLTLEKRINIPITVSGNPYSVMLVKSDGIWKARARLNAQQTVSGEEILWSGDSSTIGVVQSTIPAGKPLIVRCDKTSIGGNLTITIQLFGG